MKQDLSSISSISSLEDEDITNKGLYVIIFILAIIVLYFYLNRNVENMTGGTLTQLFANDSQDTYLKSNVDNLATGKFNLFWNQPSRVANTFMNRGSPLPSKVSLSENVDMNNMSASPKLEIQTNNMKVMNGMNNMNNLNNSCNSESKYESNCIDKCRDNPSSCGGGAGGYRLETGFIEGTTSPEKIIVDGNTVYPDSYVGSYFINPKPDIAEPYPIIINRV